MKPAFGRGADIHAGAKSYCLQAFEYLDLFRAVIAFNRLDLRGGFVEMNFYNLIVIVVVIILGNHGGDFMFVRLVFWFVAEIINRINFFLVQSVYLRFLRQVYHKKLSVTNA